jgi:hypothetical protein
MMCTDGNGWDETYGETNVRVLRRDRCLPTESAGVSVDDLTRAILPGNCDYDQTGTKMSAAE